MLTAWNDVLALSRAVPARHVAIRSPPVSTGFGPRSLLPRRAPSLRMSRRPSTHHHVFTLDTRTSPCSHR